MKPKEFLCLSVSLSLGLSLAGSLAAQRLPTKQLAGPIEEIRTGVMAPVDPVAAGIESKSAMIPVDLVRTESGAWSWTGKLAVDGDRFSMVLFAGDESWSVEVGPSRLKRLTAARDLASHVERASLELGNDAFAGDYYRFTAVEPGEWDIAVEADAPAQGRGYLLYSSDSPYRLLSYQAGGSQLVGGEMGFAGYGIAKSRVDGALEKAAGMVERASLRVTPPAGKPWTLPMLDDGRHGDELAGDGVFGGSFRAARAGEYHVQVVARGTTPEGLPFVRTAEHVVPVIAPQVELALDIASARLVDGKRLKVALPVHNADGAPEKYRVFAEVWGRDALGEMRPVSWIGGISYVDGGMLTLGLDLRWIALSEARADFELRHLRIEDPDTFIPVVRAERLALDAPKLPPSALAVPKSVDQEMLTGPRPERAAEAAGALEKAAGGKLMLVHGYCSGNAWGGVANQFSDDILFQDFHQNRSHDAFAILIGTFGASYPSFGVVAHSQGGAASLHLYTYYWSGLDWAGPGRLIQSVGTPYQGTALAGNAAVLGQIFGVGCGTNYDLTYGGASSWLSGIPSWARDDVNYYTTSFEDVWWRYDYCHLVTDLLLGDPDDGTTEKSKGQLSSGVNRGHKTKWCHTTGMRDPAQVTDSSRNSTMNSNAAR